MAWLPIVSAVAHVVVPIVVGLFVHRHHKRKSQK